MVMKNSQLYSYLFIAIPSLVMQPSSISAATPRACVIDAAASTDMENAVMCASYGNLGYDYTIARELNITTLE